MTMYKTVKKFFNYTVPVFSFLLFFLWGNTVFGAVLPIVNDVITFSDIYTSNVLLSPSLNPLDMCSNSAGTTNNGNGTRSLNLNTSGYYTSLTGCITTYGDGEYRLQVTENSTQWGNFTAAPDYVPFIVSGGVVVSGGGTQILDWTPIATSTPTTTPTLISIEYYTGSDLGSTTPKLFVSLQNQDEGIYTEIDFGFINTSEGVHSVSTTTTLTNGLYHFSKFIRANSYYYDTHASKFIVGSTSFPDVANTYFPATTTTPTLTTGIAECEALAFPSNFACSVGTMFKNTMLILWSPSADSVEQFKSLNTSLTEKFPFAYAYEAPELVETLFDSSQTATSTISVDVTGFGEITFLSAGMLSSVPYANTVKTIIGWLAWLLTIQLIYKRVIKIHDAHTPA